jgi:hypothetical protein
VRALRQVAFHSKAFLFFVVLECFSEKPARALATAIGMKLVIGKGRERNRKEMGMGMGKGERGKERKKRRLPKNFLRRRKLYNLG